MPSLIISVIIITCEIPGLVKLSLTGKIFHFPHMVTHVTHYRRGEEFRWKIFAGEDFFFFFLLFIEYLLNHSDNVQKYAIYPENTP